MNQSKNQGFNLSFISSLPFNSIMFGSEVYSHNETPEDIC